MMGWRFTAAALLLSLAQLHTVTCAPPPWAPGLKSKTEVQSSINNALLSAAGVDLAWGEYKNNFGRSWKFNAEESEAKTNFAANLANIKSINEGGGSFYANVGPYADYSNDKFKKLQTMIVKPPKARPPPPPGSSSTPAPIIPSTPPPDYVNWVEAGKVRPVRSQGSCGSCWAFAAVATVESSNAIARGTGIDLSPQHLVDCNVPDNGGCNGGFMEDAYLYLLPTRNNGSASEGAYPYTAAQGACSAARAKQTAGFIAEYFYVTPNSEEALMKAVNLGPVAVGIDASPAAIQNYGGGVFDSYSSCSASVNHAVVVAGYNKAEGWWLVRNSWGSSWGEGGYIRMAMGGPSSKGICGILTVPIMPLLPGQGGFQGNPGTGSNGLGDGSAGGLRAAGWTSMLLATLLSAALLHLA